MELEDAIKHCEEVTKENDDSAKEFYRVSKLETHPDRKYAEGVYVECKKCADEHRQLAEWLKDYKRLLAKERGVDIRCGNCKHDGTGDGVCGTCIEENYSKWEEEE